ncbi:MAG: hypothetical protein JWQ45_969 [Blastococcus sp.]|nr:hypothetical protein [Blastococcus sp.]
MRAARRSARDLALRTARPLGVVRVGADGSVRVEWANPALRGLLGLPPEGAGMFLTDALDGTGARLTAAARDLVRYGAGEVDVQVGLRRPGAHREVELRLLVDRRRGLSRLLSRRRGLRPVTAALHASAVEHPTGPAAPADGRALLADRLGAALPRLRRGSVRLVLAAASIWWPLEDGVVEPDSAETAALAERVRQASRDTDTVVAVAPGRLVVLAEDPTTGGELVLGRRVLDLLRRSAGAAGTPPRVGISVLEITDPDADPDAVVEHLQAHRGSSLTEGGLTVLAPWGRPAESDAPRRSVTASGSDAPDGGAVAEQVERAVRSGRFVMDARPLQPLAGEAPGPSPATIVEVVTVDEEVRTPVQVSAPLLGAALDRWSVEAAHGIPPTAARVVLRLQPGGLLTGDLAERAADLASRRPDTRIVLQVPERRLEEAVSAERAVLGEFPLLGVGLGVSSWSGALDVRTLVRWRIEVVQLAQACQQAVLEPQGRAVVAGLVAGLEAGLGSAGLVVAEEPVNGAVADALRACGVRWSDGAAR